MHKRTVDNTSEKGEEALSKKESPSSKGEELKFQEGDRFYGRWKPRMEYLKKYVPDLEERMDKIVDEKIVGGSKPPVIIDTINNQFLGTERNAATAKKGQSYSKEEYEALYSYKGKMEGESPEVESFRTFLEEHPKYDPRKIPQGDDNTVRIRIGRACKGALEHVTKVQGRNIHFVLDELKTNLVMENLKDAAQDRSVTGKEIKWLYRHRDDAEVMSHVKFYRDGKEVPAPWDERDPSGQRVDESWDRYDEYRASKQASKSTSPERIETPVSSTEAKGTTLTNQQKDDIKRKRGLIRATMKTVRNIFHRTPHPSLRIAPPNA
jgi:hypothetical protein